MMQISADRSAIWLDRDCPLYHSQISEVNAQSHCCIFEMTSLAEWGTSGCSSSSHTESKWTVLPLAELQCLQPESIGGEKRVQKLSVPDQMTICDTTSSIRDKGGFGTVFYLRGHWGQGHPMPFWMVLHMSNCKWWINSILNTQDHLT